MNSQFFVKIGYLVPELYDIQKDPYQINNLADKKEYSAVLKDLRSKLLDQLKETDDPRLKGKASIDLIENYPYYGTTPTKRSFK